METKNISEELDTKESIEKSHNTVGKAVLTTSLAISLGLSLIHI